MLSLRVTTAREQSWPIGKRVNVAASGLETADGLHGTSGTEVSQRELKCGPGGGIRVTVRTDRLSAGRSQTGSWGGTTGAPGKG